MNQTSSTARKEQRALWRVAGALWRASVGRWAEREFAVLAALALAAAALWGFVELAGEVLEGETHAFDERILLALRSATDRSDPLGPGWLEELMRDVTGLGSTGVLTFITLAAAGFLALDRKTHAALFVVAAVGGGMLLSTLLKMGFDRPRPDLVPHGALVYTASFPSGHATLSAVVYLTLGALLARVQPRFVLKLYLLGPRDPAHGHGRREPGVSRRALADGCARRLGARRRLGAVLLGGGAVAAAARPGRGPGPRSGGRDTRTGRRLSRTAGRDKRARLAVSPRGGARGGNRPCCPSSTSTRCASTWNGTR